jgi:hypothetical protein
MHAGTRVAAGYPLAGPVEMRQLYWAFASGTAPAVRLSV